MSGVSCWSSSEPAASSLVRWLTTAFGGQGAAGIFSVCTGGAPRRAAVVFVDAEAAVDFWGFSESGFSAVRVVLMDGSRSVTFALDAGVLGFDGIVIVRAVSELLTSSVNQATSGGPGLSGKSGLDGTSGFSAGAGVTGCAGAGWRGGWLGVACRTGVCGVTGF
ncbi:MAG: hypothetical protein M3300_00865 [Actinomycetota bacterium]|nr:hypothetical protein [Actinomycetota bacterium]